jgi:predicted MPP superfamily phosphohydrolase
MVPQLRTLTAPRGVFAVLGNHEYYAGRDRSRRLLRDAGFTVLDNMAVEVAPGLHVAGIPDYRGSNQTGSSEADLDRALAAIEPNAAVILLQHAPERERAAAGAGVDLMLNGHTHGGQIWPFHYLVRRAYPNIAGVYRVGEMTQIISRGSGQWGPPMRLFAPAEIIHITLRTAEQ